jgi:hypothetical protein
MKAEDFLRLYLYNTETDIWEEYTEGIINVDIKRGAQEYQGPFTMPDVGQMIITTRNLNLDPYQNTLVKYNNRIRITARGSNPINSSTIFSGFIEGINVDYRPKTEDSIVTITAVDLIGQLNKHVLSDAFIAQQENWTTKELLDAMQYSEEFDYVSGFFQYIADRPEYATGPISANTTAWDALTVRAKTDLGYLLTNRQSTNFRYTACDKDSPINPYNLSGYNLSSQFGSFKSDGTGNSYKSIKISDGFERVVNDLTVKGLSTTARATNNNAINEWRRTQANVTVSTNDIEDMQAIANEVLQEMSEPIREIFSITFDGLKYPDLARFADWPFSVNIIHEINESLVIDRKYAIIGVNHAISYDTWDVTLQLRNVAYQDTSIGNPIISVSPSSGNTFTDFNLSYSVSDPTLIVSQEWDLDDGFTSSSATPTVNYLVNGTKTIILTLTTIYGYTITSSILLEVAGAAPQGSISYSRDGRGVYTFNFVGEAASSYLWNFGNGKSATGRTPTTFYDLSGSVTVSCAATNSFGTTTVTTTFSATQSESFPIRYIKFKIKGAIEGIEDIYTLGDEGSLSTSQDYLSIKRIDINRAFVGKKVSDVDIINYHEYTNFLTPRRDTRVNYTRSTRAIEQELVSSWFQGNDTTFWVASYKQATPTYASAGGHVGLEFTVDMKQEYLDITSIQITGMSSVTDKRYDIEVSRDGNDWKRAGFINKSFNDTTYYQINVPETVVGETYPLGRSLTDATPEMTQYRRIRYMRFKFNAPSGPQINGFNPFWILKNLFPITGNYNWYQGGTVPWFPARNVFTYLGPSLTDSNTGAYVELAQDGTLGGIWPQSGTAIPTEGMSLARANEIRLSAPVATPALNDGTITEGYYWPTGITGHGERTFVYDLGELKDNVTGFVVQTLFMRNTLNWNITVHTSENGYEWDELGVYPIVDIPNQWYKETLARVIRTSDYRPIKTSDDATTMVSETRNLIYN